MNYDLLNNNKVYLQGEIVDEPVFNHAVKDENLKRFCTEAKKYGVLYSVLKDKNATDGITDIMVRAEDASKINRIFERFKLATVDIGEIQNEIQQEQGKDNKEKIVIEE